MHKIITRLVVGVSAVVALTVTAAVPASAQNGHSFCNSRYSNGNMLTAYERNSNPKTVVRPGRCGRGDWFYVSQGYVATNSARTLGPGWHYDGGIRYDLYRIERR